MSMTSNRAGVVIAALIVVGMATASAQAPRPSAAASRPAVPQGPGWVCRRRRR